MNDVRQALERIAVDECRGNRHEEFLGNCPVCLARLQRVEAALAVSGDAALEAEMAEMVALITKAHGDGQMHALADVNAGRVDDLIAPRLAREAALRQVLERIARRLHNHIQECRADVGLIHECLDIAKAALAGDPHDA